jgi:2-polyprenyl-6-methoxyphenol hydroxylase-like FAD-dependent oxidoreductase
MPAVKTVLVVGGGLAGLPLARALHQQGLTVEVIERSPEWRAEGGGIAVQPNGMRIVRSLGLGAAVEQHGARLQCWSFCDQDGEILSRNDLEALWGDTGPFIGVERMRLQQILVGGIAGLPCRLGTVGETHPTIVERLAGQAPSSRPMASCSQSECGSSWVDRAIPLGSPPLTPPLPDSWHPD